MPMVKYNPGGFKGSIVSLITAGERSVRITRHNLSPERCKVEKF